MTVLLRYEESLNCQLPLLQMWKASLSPYLGANDVFRKVWAFFVLGKCKAEFLVQGGSLSPISSPGSNRADAPQSDRSLLGPWEHSTSPACPKPHQKQWGAGDWGTFPKSPLFYHFLVSSCPVSALLDSCLSKLCQCFNGTISSIRTSLRIPIYHITSLTTC